MKNTTTLILATTLAAFVSTASAASVYTYALDPIGSALKMTIVTKTNEFGPALTLAHFAQAAAVGVVPGSIVPGSPPFGSAGDIAHYSGLLSVEVDPGVSVKFVGGTIEALDSSIWLPADGLGPLYPPLPSGSFPPSGFPPGAPAEYGHILAGGALGAVLSAVHGLEGTLTSGVIPLAGPSFSSAQLVTLTAGGADVNGFGAVGTALGFGTIPLAGLSDGNGAAAGSLVGAVLTIPVALAISIPLDPPPDPVTTVDLTFSGVLVAVLVPEPSALVLGSAGLVGLAAFARRRMRRSSLLARAGKERY
jgi:hypothetical protein